MDSANAFLSRLEDEIHGAVEIRHSAEPSGGIDESAAAAEATPSGKKSPPHPV